MNRCENIDIGAGGTLETCPPHFSMTQAMCPLSCSLFALLENFEEAKIHRKIYFFRDCRRSKFQNVPWSLPRPPGSMLTLFHHANLFVISLNFLPPPPRPKRSISLPETRPRCPLTHVPPLL